jgi:hypothetical protein
VWMESISLSHTGGNSGIDPETTLSESELLRGAISGAKIWYELPNVLPVSRFEVMRDLKVVVPQ